MVGRYSDGQQRRRSRVLLLLAPFAVGYFLSYFSRTLNAVVAPRLADDLALGPESLGWMTAAYFLGFALFQVPLGILLDRYGPARVQSVLLLVAGSGAALFAIADGLVLLTVARATIGVGVSGALMSAFMTIARLFEPQRRAFANGCFLIFGGLGALAATTPLEWLLSEIHWRSLFLALAAGAVVVALALFLVRRLEAPTGRPAQAASPTRAMGGFLLVLRDRQFRRIAPLACISLATIWSFQGLWTALWLRDVEGLSTQTVVLTLSIMAVCTIAGNFSAGLLSDLLARWRVPAERVMMGGCVVLQLVELCLLVGGLAPAWLLWGLFAFLTGFATLAYAIVPRGFPADLTGRALTTLNIVSLLLAFVIQSAIGVVVEQWDAVSSGSFPAAAYRWALLAVLAAQVAALLVFLRKPPVRRTAPRPASVD